MARSVRIEFPGAYYHLMARGNRREAIFLDDDDRRFFLQCLAEACEKTGWRVHAWVLMANHYHLFIETPEGNLVEGMKWLQNTVTRRFNVRHRKWGRLFGDRYKSVLVEGAQANYYARLWDYIHLNPFRAGLLRAREGASILDYPWSSIAGGYALLPRRRPKWLASETGFSVVGFSDTVAGRRKLVEYLDRRGAQEGRRSGLVPLPQGADGRMSHLRRGWYWGRQQFAQWVLEFADVLIRKGKSRAYQRSRERLAHGAAQAEKLLKEGFVLAGLDKESLTAVPANDPRKVELARLLWKRTTVSQAWIAERLSMRSAANVSLALHRTKQRPKALPAELLKFLAMQSDMPSQSRRPS
jgi:putative transposase